jgi:hypothetical protein
MSEFEPVRTTRSRTIKVVAVTLGLLSLPVLYVLSLGPLTWAARTGRVPTWIMPALEYYVLPFEYFVNLEWDIWPYRIMLHWLGTYLLLWQ